MDRPAEPLTMYGSSTDLPALDWRWVDEQLRISGSYWITANQSNGAPQSRPVWESGATINSN